MTTTRCFGVLLGCALAGCGDDGAAPTDAADRANPTTIFLNREGGSYTRGQPANSSTNTTPLVVSPVLSPPVITDPDWNTFVACVRAKFERFNVVVTEQDPGAIAHTEVVVIGLGHEIGQPDQFLNATSPTCATDGPQFGHGIAFLMWSASGNISDAHRCIAASDGIGLSLGLDRVLSCPDVMGLDESCGPVADKVFTDMDVACGDNVPRGCRCGGGAIMQNSFRYLLDLAGPPGP